MKYLQSGFIFGIVLFLGLCALYYGYHTPFLVKLDCQNQTLYRYHFGIYQLNNDDLKETLPSFPLDDQGAIHRIEQQEQENAWARHKVYGWQHFLGLAPMQCYNQIEYDQCVAQEKATQSEVERERKQWIFVRDNLYINANKQLALKFPYANHCSMMMSEDVQEDDNFSISQDRFYMHLGFNEAEEPTLKETLDLASFKQISSSFYQDKHHIYRYYDMLGGGSFSIFEDADSASFKMIGDCYAKDKQHIYEERTGILEGADYASFKSKFDIGCVAKDKNGYWLWGNREDLNDPQHDEQLLKNIRILDAY